MALASIALVLVTGGMVIQNVYLHGWVSGLQVLVAFWSGIVICLSARRA